MIDGRSVGVIGGRSERHRYEVRKGKGKERALKRGSIKEVERQGSGKVNLSFS